MKLFLEIPDNKAPEVLEVQNNIPNIRYNPIDNVDSIQTNSHKKSLQPSNKKGAILQNLKQAIEEVNLIKAGKLNEINAKDLLNEL